MVTTTQNKSLSLPTVSSDSGIWGGELNTGVMGLLDNMLGGIDTINLSASSPYTLSSTEIQNVTVKMAGALLANITVYSSCVGFYCVENNTTGAKVITWQANFGSGGVGAGWVIPQGTRTWFVSDTSAGARPCPGFSLSTVIQALASTSNLTTDGSGNFTFQNALTVNGALATGSTLNVTGVSTLQSSVTLSEVTTPAAPASGKMQFYAYSGDFVASQTPGGRQLIYGKDPTVQTFTSGSGTYTPTPGTVRIHVRMVGAGGGGGSAIGSGGSAGGTTSLGAWTALPGNGGGSGSGAGTGGTGGTNGTGTLICRFSGSTGGANIGSPTNSSGAGGSSPFGGAGPNVSNNANGISASANTGSGGGGACVSSGAPGTGGGSGEYVEFYVSAPGPLSYAVGAAGPGGAGSTNGGNGAAGNIIIQEFYN